MAVGEGGEMLAGGATDAGTEDRTEIMEETEPYLRKGRVVGRTRQNRGR